MPPSSGKPEIPRFFGARCPFLECGSLLPLRLGDGDGKCSGGSLWEKSRGKPPQSKR